MAYIANGGKVAIDGSEKSLDPKAREVSAVGPNVTIEVTIVLRRNPSAKSLRSSVEELSSTSPKKRSHLKREEFARSQGASQNDVKLVSNFVRGFGLEVTNVDLASRRIFVSGSYKQISDAFGVEMKYYEHPTMKGKTFRGRSGSINVPISLSQIVIAVLGLDDRPQAMPHFRPLLPGKRALISYTPPEVAKIYDFPQTLDGSGECVGLIELGGGENEVDLNNYFQSLGW